MMNLMKNILSDKIFLGADIETIAKAKTYQLAMKRFFNVEPSLDIREDHVRLFYKKEDLHTAQKSYANMIAQGGESDIKIDYLPVILNPTVKRYKLPIMIIAASLIFLIAKK